MAATQHVTLTELLEVQSGAISEVNGWALLCQSTVTLLQSMLLFNQHMIYPGPLGQSVVRSI